MKQLSKAEFVAELIKALEDAEIHAASRDPVEPQDVAVKTWDKLQYDFPVRNVLYIRPIVGGYRMSY